MSSKAGPRAKGTDGSDFQHREQVAAQYKISVQLKSKFRMCLLINILAAVCQLVTLVVSHFNLVESASEFYPATWQFTWMVSAVVSLIGLHALGKNKKELLRLHNHGIFMFGIGGVFFGMVSQYVSFKRFTDTGVTRRLGGVPVHYIWFVVLVGALWNYMLTIYYAIRLMSAWDVKKSK